MNPTQSRSVRLLAASHKNPDDLEVLEASERDDSTSDDLDSLFGSSPVTLRLLDQDIRQNRSPSSDDRNDHNHSTSSDGISPHSYQVLEPSLDDRPHKKVKFTADQDRDGSQNFPDAHRDEPLIRSSTETRSHPIAMQEKNGKRKLERTGHLEGEDDDLIASRFVPNDIEGLHVFPGLLTRELEAGLLEAIAKSNIFLGGARDQAMFFSSSSCQQQDTSSNQRHHVGSDGVPGYLRTLPGILEGLLQKELKRREGLGGEECQIPKPEWDTLFDTVRPPTAPKDDPKSSDHHASTAGSSSVCPADPSSYVRQRQFILNLYKAGQGITPHVDLPDRYDDGIIGICLGSGCVMEFEKAQKDLRTFGTCATSATDPDTDTDTEIESNKLLKDVDIDIESAGDGGMKRPKTKYAVYLPARTIYLMTGPSRWEWTHGIPARQRDKVWDITDSLEERDQGDTRKACWQTLLRDVRVSVTLRWMTEGADVVGND